MDKPIIAITMGDPAGIGPELIVKLLSEKAAYESCRPFVVGDPGAMREIARLVGAELRFRTVAAPSQARFAPPDVDVVRPEGLRIDQVPWGKVDPSMGRAAALCLQEAFGLALDKRVHGVVSAPLNKEALHLAGFRYLDELAFLADFTDSPGAFIMGVMDSVWTVAVAGHVPFRKIGDCITKDRILWHIEKMHHTLERTGLADPRIAVAALNVHAGDGGLLGREEIDEIEPAVKESRERGINVQGPIPADAVFVRALDGDFDAVVCMYHDQANIARKLRPRENGATLFIGLPVVCGTTAHGTAFDKAGRGIADPGGLKAALRYTVMLCSQIGGQQTKNVRAAKIDEEEC